MLKRNKHLLLLLLFDDTTFAHKIYLFCFPAALMNDKMEKEGGG